MKKLFALILTLALLVSALAACSDAPEEEKTPQKPIETQEKEDPAGPSKDPEPSETEPGETEPEKKPAEKPTIEGGEITETVLFDEMDVKITATKLECSRSGAKLTLLLENNTDKTLQFLSNTLLSAANSVNGWMIRDGHLNATVEPGKNSYEVLDFEGEALSIMGITKISDITLSIYVKDENNRTYLQTGPMELRTSFAESFDYSADTYRAVIEGDVGRAFGLELIKLDDTAEYDHYGIRVLSHALVKNESGDYWILTEVENTSDDDVDVYSEGFAINGLTVCASRWTSQTVAAGKRMVMQANLSEMLSNGAWELFGIKEVGRVDYGLSLRDVGGDDLMDAEGLTLTIPGVSVICDTSAVEVYNEGGIRISYKGLLDAESKYDDPLLILIVDNSTSDQVYFEPNTKDSTINGYEVKCYVDATVSAGSGYILECELSSTNLEDAGISSVADITELEIAFEIYDSDYDLIASPTIKIEA